MSNFFELFCIFFWKKTFTNFFFKKKIIILLWLVKEKKLFFFSISMSYVKKLIFFFNKPLYGGGWLALAKSVDSVFFLMKPINGVQKKNEFSWYILVWK